MSMLVPVLIYALAFFLPAWLVSWLLMRRGHAAWGTVAGLLVCAAGGFLAGEIIRQHYLTACGDCSYSLCCEWMVPSMMMGYAAAVAGAVLTLIADAITVTCLRKRYKSTRSYSGPIQKREEHP